MTMHKQKKVSAIIQARMGSERLPGKVLIPIGGKSVLHHIVERLKFCKLVDQTILAIPDTKENDVLEKFALANSIKYYRGSEHEVLQRVYLAAKENNCDIVVEILADNPLLDPQIIDLAIKEHVKTNADYSCTDYPAWFLPRGLGVGLFNFTALEVAYKNAKDDYHREHTTSYFQENPDAFKITRVKFPKHLESPKLRLTLDTKEDLELITNIYGKLHKAGSIFTTKEILDLFEHQPELKKINSHVIQKTRHHA